MLKQATAMLFAALPALAAAEAVRIRCEEIQNVRNVTEFRLSADHSAASSPVRGTAKIYLQGRGTHYDTNVAGKLKSNASVKIYELSYMPSYGEAVITFNAGQREGSAELRNANPRLRSVSNRCIYVGESM